MKESDETTWESDDEATWTSAAGVSKYTIPSSFMACLPFTSPRLTGLGSGRTSAPPGLSTDSEGALSRGRTPEFSTASQNASPSPQPIPALGTGGIADGLGHPKLMDKGRGPRTKNRTQMRTACCGLVLRDVVLDCPHHDGHPQEPAPTPDLDTNVSAPNAAGGGTAVATVESNAVATAEPESTVAHEEDKAAMVSMAEQIQELYELVTRLLSENHSLRERMGDAEDKLAAEERRRVEEKHMAEARRRAEKVHMQRDNSSEGFLDGDSSDASTASTSIGPSSAPANRAYPPRSSPVPSASGLMRAKDSFLMAAPARTTSSPSPPPVPGFRSSPPAATAVSSGSFAVLSPAKPHHRLMSIEALEAEMAALYVQKCRARGRKPNTILSKKFPVCINGVLDFSRGNYIGNQGLLPVLDVLQARFMSSAQDGSNFNTLILRGQGLSNDAAAALARGLRGYSNLTSLDVSENRIGMSGAHDLAVLLRSNPRIVRLFADNNDFDDRAANRLTLALEANMARQTPAK